MVCSCKSGKMALLTSAYKGSSCFYPKKVYDFMKRITMLLSVMAILMFAVSSCNSDNVATAVDYLAALNEGDTDRAAELACAEQADEIASSLMTVSAEEQAAVEFQRVSCSQRSVDEVACRFTIVQEGTDLNNDTTVEQDRSVVFDIEDGRICGFTEEVAN